MAAEAEGKAKRVPAGSLLMSFKLTIGRVGFTGVDVFPNEAIVWLEPRTSELSRRFLALWLEHLDLEEYAGRAVKGKTLNGPSLRAIPVRFPRLAEQERIVDLVKAVDEERAQALAVQQGAARTLDALAGQLCAESKDVVRISALGEIVTGSTPSTQVREYWAPAEIPFVTPGDFEGSLYVGDVKRRVSEAGAGRARRLRTPAVAQVCIGATIGKVAVVDFDACTNQQINAVTGLASDDALVLTLILRSSVMQGMIKDNAGTTTLPLINKSSWAGVTTPWPALEERVKVAAIAREIEGVRVKAGGVMGNLKILRMALLEDLLTREREIPGTYDDLLSA